ncbi:MAG TPA: hypothetical protein VFS43_17330 [Polyangiaceae bacterium]|nr:hypothetical protein [Polyangiaceae bacterium]
MAWRAFWRAASGAAFAAAAIGACTGGYVQDPAGFCLDEPSDSRCASSGGRAGAGGAGGGGGSPTQGGGGGGSGGAPLMGSSGSSGAGGAGGLQCEAPEVECGGACVNVGASAEHCGECRYACGQGSTCSAGACSAFVVVENVLAPYAFVLDAQNVYFVSPVKDTGGLLAPVRRAPRGGGPPESVFAGNPTFRSRSLALVAGVLHFGDLANGGVIFKGPADGSDGVDQHVAEGQPTVQHLIAADERLWWSSFNGGTSSLRRAPSAGDNVAAQDVVELQIGRVDALAVEGAGPAAVAYWVNRDASSAANGGLWRKGEASEPSRIATGEQMIQLAVGTDAVFVADRGRGIVRAAKAGAGASAEVVVPQAEVGGALQGIAVEGDRLYWLALSGASLELHRSGLDGAGARVLGRAMVKSTAYWAAPFGASAIVLNGGFVYFADPGTVTGLEAQDISYNGAVGAPDGAIYRLPAGPAGG